MNRRLPPLACLRGYRVRQHLVLPRAELSGRSTRLGGAMEIYRRWGNSRPSTHLPATGRVQRGCRSNCACRGTTRPRRDLPPGADARRDRPVARDPYEKVEEIRQQIAAGLVRDPGEARACPRPHARRVSGLVMSGRSQGIASRRRIETYPAGVRNLSRAPSTPAVCVWRSRPKNERSRGKCPGNGSEIGEQYAEHRRIS